MKQNGVSGTEADSGFSTKVTVRRRFLECRRPPVSALWNQFAINPAWSPTFPSLTKRWCTLFFNNSYNKLPRCLIKHTQTCRLLAKCSYSPSELSEKVAFVHHCLYPLVFPMLLVHFCMYPSLFPHVIQVHHWVYCTHSRRHAATPVANHSSEFTVKWDTTI